MKSYLIQFVTVLFLVILSSCVASKSPIIGLDDSTFERLDRKPVHILIEFSHMRFTEGFDVIPKSLNYPGISDFDDILNESLKQFTNVRTFDVYTTHSYDVKDPEKRLKLVQMREKADFVIKIDILRKKSFVGHFFNSLIALGSMTVIPSKFEWQYEFTTHVFHNGQKVFETQRSASVSNWVQPFLIFGYPFHPEERKNEEIYFGMLKDTFKEIENKGIIANPDSN
ncbi:hypothetical protein EP331_05275 [bacterium]|nr:MAG: hypothetical protein EP331_05275 [bacterium]